MNSFLNYSNKIEFVHPGKLWCFGLVVLEKKFLTICQRNFTTSLLSLIRKRRSPSSEFRRPDGVLCQVWFRLTRWYIVMWGCGPLHLKRLKSPSTKDVSYQSCLKLNQGVLQLKIFKSCHYTFTILLLSVLEIGMTIHLLRENWILFTQR